MLKKIFKLSILFISMACHLKSFSFFADYQANKSYQNKDYQTAREILQKEQIDEPDNALINYNLGTIDYKLNKQESAKNNFQRAVNLTQDNQLKEKAYFNWGNSFYKNSENILGKDWEQKKLDTKKIERATKEFEKAIEKYKNALSLNKENEKAKSNLETVENFIQKLVEKKEEEQQQQKQDQENNQEKQKGENEDVFKKSDQGDHQLSDDKGDKKVQEEQQEANEQEASDKQKEDENNRKKDEFNEEQRKKEQEKIDYHNNNASENEDQQAQPEKEGTQQQEENQALREEEANTAEAAAQEQATEETTDLKERELISLLEKLQDDESKMQKQMIWQKSKSQKIPQNNLQKPW